MLNTVAVLVVQVLGRLRVWHDDREVDAGPPARRLMLGVLALNAGRLTTRRELIESLWGERPPSSAVNVLHTHTKHLRRLLDPRHSPRGQDGVLSTVGDGYLLRLPDDALDLLRFRRTVAAAQQAANRGDPARAATLFREALRLWEDDEPLCDLPALEDHPKVWGLKTERRRAQLSYWDLMLRAGNAAEIIGALAVQGAANPLDEAVQATLIHAYQATGQRAIAFERYEATRRALADELGVEPSGELRQAHRQLLEEHENRDPPTIPRQLPAPVPDFTGRADELALLDAAHARRPPGIAIICGTAGVGKTALAVHWAHHNRERFPDGRIHLDLRGDDAQHALSPYEALGRLLTAVGVPDHDIPADTQSRTARWRTETDGRKLLVLLDNAATADQVRPLLPGTHDTLMLITSRDRLATLAALHGAHRIELDLLPHPDAAHLLRRLLGERAGTDPGSVDTLATICARLPLALRLAAEYAAAQAHLPLAGVVTRLHRAGPLDLLDWGGAAAIRHVFGCSYRLLDPETQRLFRLLSLNPAPHSTPACVAALADLDEIGAARLLHRLASAHLLRCDALGRYGFHDLLRAYATEMSLATDGDAERQAATDRLLDHYCETAVEAGDTLYPGWSGSRRHAGLALEPGGVTLSPDAALSWLDSELASFGTICQFAVRQGRPERAVTLAAALHRYLEAGHGTEALSIYACAIDAARQLADPQGEAHLRTNTGVILRLLGRYAPAVEELSQALELCRRTGNRHGQARALSNLGIIEERLGDFTSSAARHSEAIALYRDLDDPFGQAAALTNLGNLEESIGEYAEAAQHLLAAHDIFATLGERSGQAIALCNLGQIHTALGDDTLAVARLREALDLFREIEHRDGEATALSNLGTALCRQAKFDESLCHLEQALDIFRSTRHRYGEASVLNAIGETLHALGRDGEAAQRHRLALEIAAETGDEDERGRATAALESLAEAREARPDE
ncbi:AfsR/SARP family transcriptional regulator [Nonomuraea bangladeshensis]|uniref:AfsR/SARP family transcriptional regulator n=1 Tax=Nonomuraea bangladeshensis TaxID=404385 RepID=UPI0031D40BD4